MAFTATPKIIRVGKGPRTIHRQVIVKPVGADGSAAAVATVKTPPGRLVGYAIDYQNQPATTDVLIKTDNFDGATVATHTNNATDITLRPCGTTAVDEGRAATAATDGFNGGYPIRSGIFIDVAQGDGQTSGDEAIVFDFFVEVDTYVCVDLVAQSGADGAGVVTRFVDLNGAGNLCAVAIDFQNTPNTADLIIKADSTSGLTLFTSSNSSTDLAASLLGRPGQDEAANASAATDGTQAANCFKRGLFLDLAQTDAFTSGNEHTLVEMWIHQ